MRTPAPLAPGGARRALRRDTVHTRVDCPAALPRCEAVTRGAAGCADEGEIGTRMRCCDGMRRGRVGSRGCAGFVCAYDLDDLRPTAGWGAHASVRAGEGRGAVRRAMPGITHGGHG